MMMKTCLGWWDVEESICRNIRHFSSHHKARVGVGVFFSSKRFKSDGSLWSFLFLARIIKMICCALLDYGNNHVRGKGEERLTLERRRGVSGADGGITAPEEPLLRLYQSWEMFTGEDFETGSAWSRPEQCSLCRRSGLNPSSLVIGIFFHEPSSVSLRCRGMIVPLIFV